MYRHIFQRLLFLAENDQNLCKLKHKGIYQTEMEVSYRPRDRKRHKADVCMCVCVCVCVCVYISKRMIESSKTQGRLTFPKNFW